MGHGVQGDLNKVTSEYPKGPDGKEVDLLPFHPHARTLAEKISHMMERRAVEKASVPTAPSAPSS